MDALNVADDLSSCAMDERPSIETIKYTKSPWADAFTSFSLDHQLQEKYAEAIEALKEEARIMLVSIANTKTDKLVLIDNLERLGVAYHFEKEIEELLEQIFKSHSTNTEEEEEEEDEDLFITSLQFRLLRQHCYHASSGVFNKFKGEDNKFIETLQSDAKGLLSLYEAAHLRIHGEEMLDEAVAFAAHHLQRMVQQLDSPLQEQVKRALQQPLHRCSPKIGSRHYISVYEKEDSMNEILLKLAKLDFNYVQNLYKKDLSDLTRWWDEMKSQLPYARSRVIVCYIWATSFNYKPQYSHVRVRVVKTMQMLTILDDTYDNYATVGEADLFTEAMQRWNIEEVDRLPDYMKIVYRLILRVYDDYEREAAERGKHFVVPYAKETVKELCKAYTKELKWFTGSVKMPSFEDYMINTTISGCLYALCAGTFPAVRSVSPETIEWLRSKPTVFKAASYVCRHLDNVGSYERESNKGQFVTGIDIYMSEHGVSMQQAADKFSGLCDDSWKDLNMEWMALDSVPSDGVLDQVLGYARASEIFYRNHADGFTKPEVMATYISDIFVDPI